MRISKTMRIECAHFLPGYNGKCADLHGHSYIIRLSIQGAMRNDGMVMDFSKLKDIMESVAGRFDHKMLNDYMDNPTVEEFALLMMSEFVQLIHTPKKYIKLRIWETADSFVEVFGDEV